MVYGDSPGGEHLQDSHGVGFSVQILANKVIRHDANSPVSNFLVASVESRCKMKPNQTSKRYPLGGMGASLF